MTKNGDLSPGSGVTDMERLKMLFDYTKFHIGLYGTLVAALIALAGSKVCRPVATLPAPFVVRHRCNSARRMGGRCHRRNAAAETVVR